MELLRETSRLNSRIEALPEPVRRRFQDNPVFAEVISRAQTLINQLNLADPRMPVDDFITMEVEANQALKELTEVIVQTEIEVRIAGSAEVPVCPYCNQLFEILDPRAEHAVWAKFRRHVETLHPNEWRAALEA